MIDSLTLVRLSSEIKIQRRNFVRVLIYETNAQFGGEITAFLWHTPTVYVPSSFCLSKKPVLLSQRPSMPHCPPSTTYSLSLYIFIDEAWQRPNSNIA